MTDTTDDAETIREQSDMSYWLPKLRKTPAKIPYTVRVPVERRTVEEGTINEVTLSLPDVDDLRDAVREVGGPRAFVRTSQASDKHSMKSASRIDYLNESHLGATAHALAESMLMKMGVFEPTAFYVREWLDLAHEFTAFEDLPIAEELRVFLYDGDVHSTGFYWEKDAIRRADTDEWEPLWEKTRENAMDGRDYVERMAEQVAEEFDTGYWSVDFAKADNGEWYCIDMARGEASWHPRECERPDGLQDN